MSRILLTQVATNPFNPETWIPFALRDARKVKIEIWNAQGTLVRTLNLGFLPAGRYETQSRAAHWNGRNTFGDQVPSGVYFYQFQVEEFQSVRKMVILK